MSFPQKFRRSSGIVAMLCASAFSVAIAPAAHAEGPVPSLDNLGEDASVSGLVKSVALVVPSQVTQLPDTSPDTPAAQEYGQLYEYDTQIKRGDTQARAQVASNTSSIPVSQSDGSGVLEDEQFSRVTGILDQTGGGLPTSGANAGITEGLTKLRDAARDTVQAENGLIASDDLKEATHTAL